MKKENNSHNIVISIKLYLIRCYFKKTDCTQTVWSFFAFASNTLAMCRALTSGGRGRRKLGSQTPRSPRCDPMASSHSLRSDKIRPALSDCRYHGFIALRAIRAAKAWKHWKHRMINDIQSVSSRLVVLTSLQVISVSIHSNFSRNASA